jgi:uncharacterized protein
MLMIISPAKTLDFTSPAPVGEFTRPRHGGETRLLIERMRRFPPAQLQSLMAISPDLAQLNAARFKAWRTRAAGRVSRPAILAFRGDVYLGMRAETFDETAMRFAQRHLRILSGLYGVLRPLDPIQAYRLEMGTRVDTERGGNLYQFWGDRIARTLAADARACAATALVNLASQEYFHAVDTTRITLPIITPVFKERRGRELKIISFSAKRARGMMAGFAVRHAIRCAEELKAFGEDGYAYRPELSSEREWLFVREQSDAAT